MTIRWVLSLRAGRVIHKNWTARGVTQSTSKRVWFETLYLLKLFFAPWISPGDCSLSSSVCQEGLHHGSSLRPTDCWGALTQNTICLLRGVFAYKVDGMNGRDAIYANRRARKWNSVSIVFSGEFRILNGWLIPSKKVDVSLILRKIEDKLIVVVSGHPETREHKGRGGPGMMSVHNLENLS